LSLILFISRSSADLDDWIKLTNKKEENITLFEIPEINLDKYI